MNTLRVGILLTPGFTLNALAKFVDVLCLAAEQGDAGSSRCRWQLMSATGLPLEASCGLQVMPTSGLIDPQELDHIVVFGGLLAGRAPLNPATQEYLKQADTAGLGLVRIDSGPVGAALIAACLVERHLGKPAAQKALHTMQIDS